MRRALCYSSQQVTFEHLKTLVEAGKTADQPSQKVARGAMAAAVLALKKDPLGFKLRSHYLKKLEVRAKLCMERIPASQRQRA